MREKRGRDDRIRPETRWLLASIIPFLVVAFGILYQLPDHTQELFAWTIRPRMTPMMLAAAYIGGAYFFVRAAVLHDAIPRSRSLAVFCKLKLAHRHIM